MSTLTEGHCSQAIKVIERMGDFVVDDSSIHSAIENILCHTSITDFLLHLCVKNITKDHANMCTGLQHSFWSLYIPQISLVDYRLRIFSMVPFEPLTEIIASIYLDRLLQKGYIFHPNNVHRFMVISLSVARKFQEERYVVTLKEFGQASGIKRSEFMALELFFCKLIDWRLYVSLKDVENFLRRYKHELHRKTGVQHFKSSGNEL